MPKFKHEFLDHYQTEPKNEMQSGSFSLSYGTIPRRIAFAKQYNMPDREQQLRDFRSNSDNYKYIQSKFPSRQVGGVYNQETDEIYIPNHYDQRTKIINRDHELQQRLDNKIPLLSKEQKILNKAYKSVPFSEERSTINRDIRDNILYQNTDDEYNTGEAEYQNIEYQNSIINNTSDEDLIKAIENTGYGSFIINKMNSLGKLRRKKQLNKTREALKLIGQNTNPYLYNLYGKNWYTRFSYW